MKRLIDQYRPRVYVTAAAFVTTALAVYALAAPFEDPH
jgi:hypothetical protein